MAGSAELFVGLFILLGLFTRSTVLVLGFTMIVAIVRVHLENGLFMNNNGYEFALFLAVISFALIVQGGGRLALANYIAKRTQF